MSFGLRRELYPMPYADDNLGFAPKTEKEVLTTEQKRFLRPFFSNLDGPVFVMHGLPQEVMGALCSRYSRAKGGLRKMFWDEYLSQILYPEKTKAWLTLDNKERDEMLEMSTNLREYVAFLESNGGIEKVVNVQRAQKFFRSWLSEFGDDSIAEEAVFHVGIEGMSNVALEELVSKRVGLSLIVKSTRYVDFADKYEDGSYRYVVPGEIRGTNLEYEYKKLCNGLFDLYRDLADPYLDYIKEKYPKGEDESNSSFERSRIAKRFDDLRDLLPFATQINGGFVGNMRAWEDVVNRLMYHELGELRWLGQSIVAELARVAPSMIERPQRESGARTQIYRHNMNALKDNVWRNESFSNDEFVPGQWARLIDFTLDADVEILATFVFSGTRGASLGQLREYYGQMSKNERAVWLEAILSERRVDEKIVREKVRFRKVPRAFENAHYMFELFARGGDFRDLHRHRQMTMDYQPFTTRWGYDLEDEVWESPFVSEIVSIMDGSRKTYESLRKMISPWVAQYLVPFAFIQHWYMHLSARELYWMGELRTGPQGRPHYREVVQQMVSQAKAVSPNVFSGILVDNNDYSLARRESEIKAERRGGK